MTCTRSIHKITNFVDTPSIVKPRQYNVSLLRFFRCSMVVEAVATAAAATATAVEGVTGVRARSAALLSARTGFLADVPRATSVLDRYVYIGITLL